MVRLSPLAVGVVVGATIATTAFTAPWLALITAAQAVPGAQGPSGDRGGPQAPVLPVTPDVPNLPSQVLGGVREFRIEAMVFTQQIAKENGHDQRRFILANQIIVATKNIPFGNQAPANGGISSVVTKNSHATFST